VKNLFFKNSLTQNTNNSNKELLESLNKIIKACQEKLHNQLLKDKLEKIIEQSVLLMRLVRENQETPSNQSKQEEILHACQDLYTQSLQLPCNLLSEEQNYFYSVSHQIAVIALYLTILVLIIAITWPCVDMYFSPQAALSLAQALIDSLVSALTAILPLLGLSATSYSVYTLHKPTVTDLEPLKDCISAYCDKITEMTDQNLMESTH